MPRLYFVIRFEQCIFYRLSIKSRRILQKYKTQQYKNTFDPVNNIDALAVDFLFIFTAFVMLLSGCASVPEDVKTNNKNTENNSCETDAVRSTLTEALENSSDIYNNDYKQIKIAEGPDLDFSGVSGVMDYTLSAAARNDDDMQKVLAFFNKEGLYGETVSKEQGTAIDGEWVQYSAEDIAVLCNTVHEMENGSIQRIS